MRVVWDMETGDPDDFLTLLFLLGHPGVELAGVTVTPGTPEQIGVVRHALRLFARDIPVGAFDLARAKPCVSPWHYRAYGEMLASREAVHGPTLLRELCDEDTTLVTGGPLKNLGAALRLDGFRLGRLVVQGGFAGEGVVPAERQLAKFRGRTTCPSYNLNGDPKAALAVAASAAIGDKRFVSKNVCHGVVYDAAMHARFAAVKDRSRSLALIYQGMATYLETTPSGKAFHDPLAAACAIDPAIAEWAEVEIYRANGEWGARLAPGSGVRIITGYDHARFVDTLTAS